MLRRARVKCGLLMLLCFGLGLCLLCSGTAYAKGKRVVKVGFFPMGG